MSNYPVGIRSGIIVAIGAFVSIVGLVGCAVYSITPSGTIGLHPAFTVVAVIGIAIVIGSSFVEAGALRKSRDPEEAT